MPRPLLSLPRISALGAAARLFDCSLSFSVRELECLLASAASPAPGHLAGLLAEAGGARRSRARLFASLQLRRHREEASWRTAPVAPLFHYDSLDQWREARARLRALGDALRLAHGSIAAAFTFAQAGCTGIAGMRASATAAAALTPRGVLSGTELLALASHSGTLAALRIAAAHRAGSSSCGSGAAATPASAPYSASDADTAAALRQFLSRQLLRRVAHTSLADDSSGSSGAGHGGDDGSSSRDEHRRRRARIAGSTGDAGADDEDDDELAAEAGAGAGAAKAADKAATADAASAPGAEPTAPAAPAPAAASVPPASVPPAAAPAAPASGMSASLALRLSSVRLSYSDFAALLSVEDAADAADAAVAVAAAAVDVLHTASAATAACPTTGLPPPCVPRLARAPSSSMGSGSGSCALPAHLRAAAPSRRLLRAASSTGGAQLPPRRPLLLAAQSSTSGSASGSGAGCGAGAVPASALHASSAAPAALSAAAPMPPPRAPVLLAAQTSFTGGHRNALMRQHSEAVRTAAASAEDARRRAALRAYRRAASGDISVSEAANLGDLVVVGMQGPANADAGAADAGAHALAPLGSGGSGSACAPTVVVTADGVCRINNPPRSAGTPPAHQRAFAQQHAGSLAVAPRGIVLAPPASSAAPASGAFAPAAGHYFEAELVYMAPSNDAAMHAHVGRPTFAAAVAVVPAGYSGGLPGLGLPADIEMEETRSAAGVGARSASGASSAADFAHAAWAATVAGLNTPADFARAGVSLAVRLLPADEAAAGADADAEEKRAQAPLRGRYEVVAGGAAAPLGAAASAAASTTAAARYRDVLGCGVSWGEGSSASVQFFLNGIPAGAPITLPRERVGTGLVPMVWLSSAAHNSAFPLALRINLGAPPEECAAPLAAGGGTPRLAPAPFRTAGLPLVPGGASGARYAAVRARFDDQLAVTILRQAGSSAGQLLPTGGGPLVIEAPAARPEGAPPLQPGSIVRPPLSSAGAAAQAAARLARSEWFVTGRAEFPSGVLSGVALSSGRWYWEATVTRNGLSQIGWADVSFIGASGDGLGVGDDKNSYAFDGDRVMTWFDGKRTWGWEWKVGDVVCFCADLDARWIAFARNGNWSARSFAGGFAFINVDCRAGLAPAVTVQADYFAARINFGAGALSYAPPPGSRPVHDWLLQHGTVPALRNVLGLPRDRAAAEAALAEAKTGAAVRAAAALVAARDAADAAAAVRVANLGAPDAATAAGLRVEALSGWRHALVGDLDLIAMAHGRVRRARASGGSGPTAALLSQVAHDWLCLGATAMAPTIALLPPADAAAGGAGAGATSGAGAALAVVDPADGVLLGGARFRVLATGPCAIGFVNLRGFGGSVSDGTGLGLGECNGSVALLNLPRGRALPHLLTQDREESGGCLSGDVYRGAAGMPAGSDDEGDEGGASSGAGRGRMPAPRRDQELAAGVYLAVNVPGASAPTVMRRVGAYLRNRAEVSASVEAVSLGVWRFTFRRADGSEIAEHTVTLPAAAAARDAAAPGGGAPVWVPGVTVSAAAALAVKALTV